MKAIIGYSYLVIFSGWILNLLQVSPETGKHIQQVVDLIPFLLFLCTFKLHRNGRCLPDTAIFWGLVISFLLFGLAITYWHGGSVSAAYTHWGAMFRYVPCAGILSCRRLGQDDVNLFLRYFRIISFILVGIGLAELAGGRAVMQFFKPITEEFNTTAYWAVMDQDVSSVLDYELFGIFPNTVDYSFFLLISYVILSNDAKRTIGPSLGMVYLFLIFMTGSKATLIIFFLVLSIQLSKYKVGIAVFWSLLSIVVGILIYQFWELFYWTVFVDSQASRLGYIIFTLPDFVSEWSLDTLFGVSPDRTIAWEKINSYSNAPAMTWGIDHMTSFEDEFYVALLVYYGLIGIGILFLLFFGLYKSLMRGRWANNILQYRTIVKSLFICVLIAALFNQIIILKPFSLFFWLTVGIMTSQMHPQCRIERKPITSY